MLWVPTMHGDDECTRVEDHPPWEVVANAPSMNPSRLSLPIPSLASRPSPESRPSPAPTDALAEPPAAAIPSLATPPRTRFPQATPMHASPMHALPMQPLPMPMQSLPMHAQAVTPGRFYSYAETCAQHVDATAPVAPLPFADLATNTFPRQIPRWSRIAMPIGGAVAIALFIAAFFGSSDRKPPAITSHAEVPATVVAAAAPASTEIPANSLWKPRPVVPTMADPAVEAAAVEVATVPAADPVVEAAAEAVVAEEIEVAPAAVKRPSKRASSSKKQAQRVATQAPRTVEDPVLAEIAKPATATTRTAKGPGKAVVSSDTPSLVYIDGRATGLKTPTTINLAPGAHKITLISVSTRKAKTADVEIKSGVSIKVHRELGASRSASRSKGRRVKVDASSPLGDLRPGKAW